MAAHTSPLKQLVRCAWAEATPLLQQYHDEEWGTPERDNHRLFAKLLLDGMQAGLSWRTILERRRGMQSVLHDFDPRYLASRSDAALGAWLLDARLIRNRQKIWALRQNARAYLALTEAGEDFSGLLWGMCAHLKARSQPPLPHRVPTQTATSRAMSAALKKRGFAFCGPVIVYAFMQAVGMVNDHVRGCHRALCGPAR